MLHQDLNPHVVNVLLCLGGIAFSLALIGWGMWRDRRQAASEEEAASQVSAVRRPRLSRPVAPAAPRLTARQVA